MTIDLETNDITNVDNSSAASTINSNFDAVKTALEKALNKEGGSGNSMSADIDMDGNDILNVATINGYTIAEFLSVKNGEPGLFNHIVLTQSEFDALTPNDNTIYYIID